MLNLMIEAAAGRTSHNSVFDALFGIDRIDYLALCPAEYVKDDISGFANIISLEMFKKEACNKMELSKYVEQDDRDHIVDAVHSCKSVTSLLRIIYGVNMALLTTMLPTDPAKVAEMKVKFYEKDGLDGANVVYTERAIEHLMNVALDVFGPKDTVEDAPVAKAQEPHLSEMSIEPAPVVAKPVVEPTSAPAAVATTTTDTTTAPATDTTGTGNKKKQTGNNQQ